MALRVYRIVVAGCPRMVIAEDGSFKGVGKSSLCNRFVRPEAYIEDHDSVLSDEDWTYDAVLNGDHFVYWGAATRRVQDGSKARFQVVEQTEFYQRGNSDKLCTHPAKEDYIARASAVRFTSRTDGKVSYRLQIEGASARAARGGRIRATQLFPNEDFGGKTSHGVHGYLCVFDPTLEDDQMKKQLDYLGELLHALGKRKKKMVIVCVKCDAVDATKIRYGSNLAHYALKKPIPFIEVSSRENVNIEDAFYALIGPPKKRKVPKNGKRAPTSGYLTYREAVGLQKQDLNQAKDAYRRLLQRKITNFSCVWSDVFPMLEKEPEFSLVFQLGGQEGKDIVKKMFCLRLIEIKLMEASKLFGFSSARKKLDKDQSRSHQVHLSEAFRGHPDLGNESVYDYVYSPGASLVDEMFISPIDDASSDWTEPSTPNTFASSRDTPDFSRSFSPAVPSFQGDSPPLPSRRPRSVTMYPMMRYFDSATLPFPGKKMVEQLSASRLPPPSFPPRENSITGGSPLRKNNTTKSQSFLDDGPKPGTLNRESANEKLSNSMDCLLVPEDGSKVDAEPYMEPVKLKNVLSNLPPLPPLPPTPIRERDSTQFMSMRVPNRSPGRPPLPNLDSFDSLSVHRTDSTRSQGHRRTRSNPWVLENSTNVPPPPVPPRSTGAPPPVPPRDTPKHRYSKTPPLSMYNDTRKSMGEEVIVHPIESSLDFPSQDGPYRRSFTLPHSIRPGSQSPQMRVQEEEDDNLSTVSGPFEEIDDTVQKENVSVFERSVSPSDVSVTHYTLNGRKNSTTVPEEDSDDDYAKIDEFRKYVPMASATAQGRRSTLQPRCSPVRDDIDNDEITKEHSKTFPHQPQKGFRGHSASLSNSSAPKLNTMKWNKKRTEPSIRESPEDISQRNSFTSPFKKSTPKKSPKLERNRPLPPSPTKGMRTISNGITRKGSSGSNIYEVIDEDFMDKVGSRRQASMAAAIPEWAPPVDPNQVENYLEIVQKFFSIPEVYQQWLNTIQVVLPDANPRNFPPPFYSPLSEDSEAIPATHSPVPKQASPRPPLKKQQADQTPILLPNHISDYPPSLGSERVIKKPVARSPHSSRFRPHAKKAASREDMIEFLNQQFNQGASSDSESEDSDSESDTESDSDPEIDSTLNELHHVGIDPSQVFPTARASVGIEVQTDLDTAAMRKSLSADSDLASDCTTTETAVVESKDPLTLIPRRDSSRRRGELDTRNLSDSGISNCHSQTFEEGFSVPNLDSSMS